MSTSTEDIASTQQQPNSFYAALARTGTRTFAIYFSRPVRIFRPSKLSGWQSLRALAAQSGTSLSPQYVASLARTQFMVLPRHFVPPVLVNAVLGTVLWTTYAEASLHLEPLLGPHPTAIAALSGAAAGAAQACAAAPVENVRMIVEGGSAQAGWSCAWREVFLQSEPISAKEGKAKAKEVREWVKEIRDMAGRGWDGWGWGLAKDACGFGVFFAIFEVTRRVAIQARYTSESAIQLLGSDTPEVQKLKKHTPRTVHGITLVAGGVTAGLAYEMFTRPFDVARRAVHLERIAAANAAPPRLPSSLVAAVAHKLKDDGVISFFRDPANTASNTPIISREGVRRRLMSASRMLARVGPWGVGFLVWESLGPGLS